MGWKVPMWNSPNEYETPHYQEKYIKSGLGEYYEQISDFTPEEMRFSSSWDWIMPACNKWDNLYKDDPVLRDRNTDTYAEYIELCDKLDNAVTTYNINDAYLQLVSNIEWYNKQKS